MEWEQRRKGYFTADEKFVDWCDGVFVALYERHRVAPDRPRTWLSTSKPRVLAAYTHRQMIFTGRGFRRSCPLVSVARAEVHEGNVRVLFDGSRDGFSLIVFTPDEPTGARFVQDLTDRRDLEAATLEDVEAHMNVVRRIRRIPAAVLVDQLLQPPDAEPN